MPLQIIRQDITKMRVDAIVNTTNSEMVGYSGVDLAVHTAAGAELDAECEILAPLGLGEAKITRGYNLPCKYVIHTSGPVWHGGNYGEADALRSCYIESLKLAVKNKCKTVAFPLISAGVYCFPKDQVLKFAVQTITEFLFDHELTVYICVFDRASYTFSQKLFNDIQEFIDDEYVKERNKSAYDVLEDLEDHDESCAPAPRGNDSRRLETIHSRMQKSADDRPVMRSEAILCNESPKAKEDTRASGGGALDDFVINLEKSFQEKLFEFIDKSGMTDVECYKRANIDKRIFSKIKSNKSYHPSKQTAIAFAISLRLSFKEAQELLATAGFTLSRSSVFDLIIMYFIQSGNYDIFEINETLFEFEQTSLGSF